VEQDVLTLPEHLRLTPVLKEFAFIIEIKPNKCLNIPKRVTTSCKWKDRQYNGQKTNDPQKWSTKYNI
jgi:hypothetical protein